jgi:hypothetical protein
MNAFVGTIDIICKLEKILVYRKSKKIAVIIAPSDLVNSRFLRKNISMVKKIAEKCGFSVNYSVGEIRFTII